MSQATSAVFSGLYIERAVLVFVRAGMKRVVCPIKGELVGGKDDLFVFPAGSVVTMENRPLPDADYRAVAVSFSTDLIEAVFEPRGGTRPTQGIRLVPAHQDHPAKLLPMIEATMKSADLPEEIIRHRMMEPLIWLRHRGLHLAPSCHDDLAKRVRRLVSSDLGRAWRSEEVARHLAISEATMRRSLSREGTRFSQVLHDTRLEFGLSQLQTTREPISDIALSCGFRTPSHFSDAFRKRFGIRPIDIRSAQN
ncbi:MAG: helix-turn-helix transcriptional regulator [Parvularcula sp.]|jgi:AraC-like DNA-binding protein|nr:helix-turn-helix transcriptional regulator [Parvularcula sp.]